MVFKVILYILVGHFLKGFNVSIFSTGSEVEEGDRITLTCVHNLTDSVNVTYEWEKDSKPIEETNQELTIEKAFSHHQGLYVCIVESSYGRCRSAPLNVTVNDNNVIILVVCACAALLLVIIMGIAMKVKMHRDKSKNQQRNQQRLQEMRRAQDLHNHGRAPNTIS